MTLHAAVLSVHVFAGVLLVGHSLLTPLLLAAIRRAPTPGLLLGSLELARDSGRPAPFAALALLASGLYLSSGMWTEGWILAALVLFPVNSALAMGIVKSTGERLARRAVCAGTGPITGEMEELRNAVRWTVAADVLLANDVAALVLMTAKPGLLGSALLIAGANVALLGFRALRRARAQGAAPGLTSVA
jgi:hypothetical protein